MKQKRVNEATRLHEIISLWPIHIWQFSANIRRAECPRGISY